MPWLIVSSVMVKARREATLRRFCCSHSRPIRLIASVAAMPLTIARRRSDRYCWNTVPVSIPTMTISGYSRSRRKLAI